MPAMQVVLVVDAATFAGLSADDYPDGQQVRVSDTGVTWESSGADGSRVWVEVGRAGDGMKTAGRFEVLMSGTGNQLAAVTTEAEDDWVYGWVPD